MLHLTVDPIFDLGYIDLAEGPGLGPGTRTPCYRLEVPELEGNEDIDLILDYDHDRRIVGMELLKPSCKLVERFRACEDDARHPVYLTVDYPHGIASIAMRRQEVEVTFDEETERARVEVRELPSKIARTAGDGPVRLKYDDHDRIVGITIIGISEQLPERFLVPESGEK
jgi:YD repeat-containing protein